MQLLPDRRRIDPVALFVEDLNEELRKRRVRIHEGFAGVEEHGPILHLGRQP
jgi:hypothetical protein